MVVFMVLGFRSWVYRDWWRDTSRWLTRSLCWFPSATLRPDQAVTLAFQPFSCHLESMVAFMADAMQSWLCKMVLTTQSKLIRHKRVGQSLRKPTLGCCFSCNINFIYWSIGRRILALWTRPMISAQGLLPLWSIIGRAFIRVVFLQGDLLPLWSITGKSFIRVSVVGVVFLQVGLLPLWSIIGRSFIRVVCHQGGLSSGWCFTTVVYHRKVFHHGVPTILGLAVATIISDYGECVWQIRWLLFLSRRWMSSADSLTQWHWLCSFDSLMPWW